MTRAHRTRTTRSSSGRRTTWRRITSSAIAAGFLGLAGCAGTAGTGATTSIDYWLWESLQLPGYQKCAEAFERENPDIDIRITQYGWGDYWQKLSAGLVAGAGPDVFTDHLTKYPEFVSRDVLLPLDSLEATKEIDPDGFQEGLLDLWTGLDGKRYGMPKDFDTIALFYDNNVLEEAGMTAADLDGLTWNPEDGGSFEKVIAHLSVDANGVRGDEPGFDKNSIAVYGLGLNASGGGNGQTEWSQYAFSNGWTHTDENPWGEEFNYGDPNFIETIAWFQSLAERGYMPTFQIASSGIGQIDAYGAGKYAMVTEGSWNTKSYVALDGVTTVIAPVPEGPNGQRASMFNGLADSVAATTQHPEEAKRLALFLASKDCQDITASKGIAFPAVESSAEISRQAFAEAGIDTAPFQVPIEEGSTYLAPVAENWAELQAIMGPAMDAILSLEADPSTLVEANEQVNALFQ